MASPRPLSGAAGFIALVLGVALCVKAGANPLIAAAYVVATFAVERQPTQQRYLLMLASGIAVAIAIAVAYTIVERRPTLDGVLVASGLILICVGRLRRMAP